MEQHAGGKWLSHGTNTHQDMFAFPIISHTDMAQVLASFVVCILYDQISIVADDLTTQGAKEKEVDIWYDRWYETVERRQVVVSNIATMLCPWYHDIETLSA